LLLLLEIILSTTAFLAAPFYWYVICPESFRKDWYYLLDYSNRNSAGTVWRIEVTRWSLFGLHIILQVVISRRISILLPIVLAKMTKWSQKNSPKDFDPFKSIALQKTSQLLAACSGHIFNFVSCWSLYAVTRHLFYRDDAKDRTWQYFLERTVLMVAVSMGAMVMEKVLLHFLAIEFHRSLHQERVFKSMYSQWTLSTLRSFLQFVKTAKPTTWTKETFQQRNSNDLIATFLLENAPIKNSRSNNKDQLFKEMFKYFDVNNEGIIRLDHFQMVFTDEDARKVQNLLAGDKKSESTAVHVVNRETLKKSIQYIHQDRWDLMQALNTHASIVRKLDKVMLGFIFAVILYFSPMMGYELDKSNVLNFGAALAPLILSFTELFGDPLKRIAEAIIYIVTCHPYDVGDRVSIDGVDFFVQKIGLVSTMFKRFDGFAVWIPNYVLAKKALCNIRRTSSQGQRLEIHVDSRVPIEKIQLLSNSIKEFIRNDTKDFEAVTASFFDLQQLQNRLVLVFLLRHRFNFQDGIQRAERQNRFLLFLKDQVDKLGIDYEPPVLRAFLESDEQIKNHLANIGENLSFKNKDDLTSL
jgi:small-conductance mechanosensitive channel